MGAKANHQLVLRRILAWFLPLLLLIFCAWAVRHLIWVWDLRGELESQLSSLEDVRRLRTDLELLRADGLSGELAAGTLTPQLLAAGKKVDQMTERELEEDMIFSFQRLKLALDELRRWPRPSATDQDMTDEDSRAGAETTFWSACQTAISAATSLEARLQHRVTDHLRRLDRHWWSLDVLVLGTLLLALTNFGLLRLVRTRRRELSSFREETTRRASRDALTGLWNRDAILKLLREEVSRSARTGTPIGLALVELDDFKETNLLLGDQQGDFIIEQMSGRLQAHMRPYDSLGRFEGHTFLVLLPTCDVDATRMVVERLQAALHQDHVEHALGRVKITSSLVYTTIEKPTLSTDAHLLVHRLQERLVEARFQGGPGSVLAMDRPI